jgi:hypothetical protein
LHLLAYWIPLTSFLQESFLFLDLQKQFWRFSFPICFFLFSHLVYFNQWKNLCFILFLILNFYRFYLILTLTSAWIQFLVFLILILTIIQMLFNQKHCNPRQIHGLLILLQILRFLTHFFSLVRKMQIFFLNLKIFQLFILYENLFFLALLISKCFLHSLIFQYKGLFPSLVFLLDP